MTDNVEAIRAHTLGQQAELYGAVLKWAEGFRVYGTTEAVAADIERRIEIIRAVHEDTLERARRIEDYNG